MEASGRRSAVAALPPVAILIANGTSLITASFVRSVDE
jgi:hypothetical protein